MFEPEEKGRDSVVKIEFKDSKIIEFCITLGNSMVVLTLTSIGVMV